MDRTEAAFVGLFSRLREDLRAEPAVGLALKAQGSSLTLRVRSERQSGDGRQPFFAVVVGLAERDGAFRVTYDPTGTPSAERQVTIVEVDSAEELHGLVRRYLDEERQRLVDHQRGA